MTYRLALDLGSTSMGWCLLSLDNGTPNNLMDMGVRIFPDGRDDKSKEPLAVARRGARGMRRNLDRRDLRQKRLMAFLIEHGLMPRDEAARKALEELDPYKLRTEALNAKLPLHHLGRALFHLNQRRGFKSNRKTDKRENDASAMKRAIQDLGVRLLETGSRTLGEFLYKQIGLGESARVQTRMEKNKATYNLYPDRKMYADEVDKILESQRRFHPELTDKVINGIRDIIFYQRNLLQPKIGNCRFESNKERARLALPLVQRFRILQEVNNLEIYRLAKDDPALKAKDREKVIEQLLVKDKLTFSQIRTLSKLPRDCRFNLEAENRKELKGDKTSALMADATRFGPGWFKFSSSDQKKIIEFLVGEQDPDTLVEGLVLNWNLSPDQAEAVADAHLDDGYGAVSEKAILNMLPFLEQGKRYAEAAQLAGYHHSDFRTGEVFDHLPYYGKVLENAVIGGSGAESDRQLPEKFYGKVNNPTVHIAMNQVRKLVNALIDRYGKPEEIVIELARDLKEPVEEVIKDQAANKKKNDQINAELEKLGQKQNYRNRMLFKLWEDLAKDPALRCCPFSGKTIAPHQIFNGEFEEEHLLPFSKSFNDGRANKVLSCRQANRYKGNQTPFEAFGHTKEWNDILARVQNLPKNKQWRFTEDAYEKAKGEGEDIIARQLNDTRYMTRLVRLYLSAVFDNEKGKSKVWAVPGQMTYLLRDKWGLNDLLGEDDGKKERGDHRHHAIDAFVIGCTDRGMLKRVAAAAEDVEGKSELWEKRRKLVLNMPGPFENFLEQLEERSARINISFKPDHGGAAKAIHAARPYTVAPLHEQTAYGLISPGEKKGALLMATRKPLEGLLKRDQIAVVADTVIKANLLKAVEGLKEGGPEWKQALADYSARTKTRRVRIHIEKTEDVLIGMKKDKTEGATPYKYYALGGNYCAEIYCPSKGKLAGKWQCEVISNYHAHQKDFISDWRKAHPTAKLIMRLHINDNMAYEENGATLLRRVRKMDKSGRCVLVDPLKAKLEKSEGWYAYPAGLQLKNARKISVDILGRVHDPVKIAARKAAE